MDRWGAYGQRTGPVDRGGGLSTNYGQAEETQCIDSRGKERDGAGQLHQS